MLIYNYETEDGVLCHHGVKGMKWGRRKAVMTSGGIGKRRARAASVSQPSASRPIQKQSPKKNLNASQTLAKIKSKGKEMAKSKTVKELTSRGKAAIDVLMNGDKDWMGNPVSNGSGMEEARSRGKAALERLMYSEEQINNKKFYGEYNPFS